MEFSVNAASTPAGTASASITFFDTYATAGPVRPGTMRGFFQPSMPSRYGGFFSYSLSAPGLNFPSIGPSLVVPITLGQSFTVSMSMVARSLSDDGTQSFVNARNPLSLSFFEADGVTPVALAEVPEPRSAALIGAVLLASLGWRRR